MPYALQSKIKLKRETKDFKNVIDRILNGDNSLSLSRFLFSVPLHENDNVNGSQLWSEFTQSNGYYVTRNEIALIQKHSKQLGSLASDETNFVEFGPGPIKAVKQKTYPILSATNGFNRYDSIDICREYAHKSALFIRHSFPYVRTSAINKDFCSDVVLPASNDKIGLLFGTTIGNIDEKSGYSIPQNTVDFLRKIRRHIDPKGKLLITQDTNQDPVSLSQAYGSKISSMFRLNILHRIVRDLKPIGFNPDSFTYQGEWNNQDKYYAGYAVATKNQVFFIGKKKYQILAGSRICLFRTYKYSAEMFKTMASLAGFEVQQTLFDEQQRVALHVLG